jgi:hypothetical protein
VLLLDTLYRCRIYQFVELCNSEFIDLLLGTMQPLITRVRFVHATRILWHRAPVPNTIKLQETPA